MDYLLMKIKDTNKVDFLPYIEVININKKYKIPINIEKRFNYYLHNYAYQSQRYLFLNIQSELEREQFEIDFIDLIKSNINEGYIVPQNFINKYCENIDFIYYLFPAYNLQGSLINEKNISWATNIFNLKIVQFSQYYWLLAINTHKAYKSYDLAQLYLLKDNCLYNSNIKLELFNEFDIIINTSLINIKSFLQYYINYYKKQIIESINKFNIYIKSQFLIGEL